MKRIYLIILMATMTLCGMAQTIGEAFYVFCNNGKVAGFLPDEVQSIEFSSIDTAGNKHDEIVTQIVNTIDSIYKFSLADIDSVSFVTPQAEYQPDAINISEQLMPFVISSDSLTIILSKTTPISILPAVGNKLVTLEMNEKFPYGFAGKVVSIKEDDEGYNIECILTNLEDIFITYYNTSAVYGYCSADEHRNDNNNPKSNIRRRVNWYENPTNWGIDQDIVFNKFSISYGTELDRHRRQNDDIMGSWATKFSLGMTPSFHIVSTLVIRREQGVSFMASITGNIVLDEELAFSGDIKWSHDVPFANVTMPIPNCPVVRYYIQPGIFFNAEASLSMSAKWTQTFTFGAAFEMNNKGMNAIQPTLGGRMPSSDFEIEGSLNGRFAAGLYLETGFNVMSREVSRACIRGELGVDFIGNLVFSNTDIANADGSTAYYERLKSSSFEANIFTNATAEHRTGRWGKIENLAPWNLTGNIRKWDIVPTFSNVTFKQCDNPKTSANASIDISGDCLFPVTIGLSVRDKDGIEVSGTYASTKFDNGNRRYPYTFEGLSTSEDYNLYPKVKIFDTEVLAQPSVEMERSKAANISMSTNNPNNGWREPPTDVRLSAYIMGDAPYITSSDGFVVDGIEVETQSRTEVIYNPNLGKYMYRIETHLPKTGYFAPNTWHSYYPFTIIDGNRIDGPTEMFVSYPGVFLPSLSVSTKAEYGGFFAIYKAVWDDLPAQLAYRSESLYITKWGGASEFGIVLNNERHPLVSSPELAYMGGMHADGGLVGEYSVERNKTYTCSLYVIVDGVEYRGKSTTFSTYQ